MVQLGGTSISGEQFYTITGQSSSLLVPVLYTQMPLTDIQQL
jgi:hypothetical protein